MQYNVRLYSPRRVEMLLHIKYFSSMTSTFDVICCNNPCLLATVSCSLADLEVYYILLLCSYCAQSVHYMRVRWVGQRRISFVGMFVTLVLTCIGYILLHFLVYVHLLRRGSLCTEATESLSMNGAGHDAPGFSFFQVFYYVPATFLMP